MLRLFNPMEKKPIQQCYRNSTHLVSALFRRTSIKFRALFLRLLFCAGFFGFSQPAFSYVNFIGYGYTSCATCHYNPNGNGPLTDYGRALYSSTLAGRLFVPNRVNDEKLASYSGFFGRQPLSRWFRPQLNTRILHVRSDFLGASEKTQNILMQFDADFVGKFFKYDRLAIVITMGIVPTFSGAGSNRSVKYDLLSRHHYLNFRLTKHWSFLFGKTDKIYGLRIPDHTAYSRIETRNTQNDQVHGAQLQFASKRFEMGASAFLGDLVQSEKLRPVGLSTMAEAQVIKRLMLGGSLLVSFNSYVQMIDYAFHGRYGFKKGMSVVSEMGWVKKIPRNNPGSNIMAFYSFNQGQFRLFRGFHGLMTLEYTDPDSKKDKDTALRFTPGIQYFPVQRVELRLEFQHTEQIGANKQANDLLAQFHLSF